MAYDPNAAYEAPRRPYYGQAQQPAPAQSMNRTPLEEQYGNGYGQTHNDNYDRQYEQGHDQNYDQGHGRQQYDGQDSRIDRQHQQPNYSEEYDAGYQRQQDPQYNNGNSQYRDANPQQQPGRSHDPRYHQRLQNSAPKQGYGQMSGSGPPRPPHQADRQGYQVQPQNHRRPVDSRNGMQNEASMEKNERYGQQNGGPPSLGKVFDNGHAQEPVVLQKSKKLTMEEWKANERAKLHAELPLETIAQDNAFPKFNNIRKDGQKHDDHGRGGGSAMGYRSSDERARPSTSSNRPDDRNRQERRAVMSPDSTVRHAQRLHDSAPQRRPPTDRNPSSFVSMRDNLPHEQDLREPSYGTRSSVGSAQLPNPNTSRHDPRDVQRPKGNLQSSLENQQSQDPRYGQTPDLRSAQHNARPDLNQRVRQEPLKQYSQPHVDVQQTQSDGRMPLNTQDRQYRDTSARHANAFDRQENPMTKHAPTDLPHDSLPAMSIDFNLSRKPVALDHQPFSPSYLPERSSSAQGSRRPSAAQGPSTLRQYHQDSATQQTVGLHVPETNNKHVSLTDLYDDYHVAAVPVASMVHSRDDEIEAEMPDFDSAASSQKSMLHKRNQTIDRHLANAPLSAPPPPMPVMSARLVHPSVHSPPVQSPQAYQSPSQYPQQPYQAASYHGQPPSGGFDFGLQQSTGDSQHVQSRQPQSIQQQQESVYDQYGVPQPPYVQQSVPRRSVDSAGEMPYQQVPSHVQRAHGNGPPNDPYYVPANEIASQMPLQRPDVGRYDSIQTTWSDPGLQRVNSTPAAQAGIPRPPRSANGVLPEYHQQNLQCNPDALPRHPPPVRPGLIEQAPLQPAKPPPIRNYNNGSTTSSTPSMSSHAKVPSVDHPKKPITRAELERLQVAATANPNSPRQALLYVKALVEAASVLASEGGRADSKTTSKNRERYSSEAYKRLRKLASAGHPDAQFYLADCHGSGMLGLVVDPKEAFNLYQAAAKAGHGQAAYRTAVCCEIGPEEGGGTRKDLAKAVQWYRRAAALGDVAAMYKLGMILLKGLLGQQENITDAVTWLKRSAERADRDNPHALHELATLYEPANIKPQVRNKIIADEQYACELFQQAAGLGYKISQFRLGQAYEYGHLGLPLDHRSSIQWYSKAAAQGEHQAELALSGWYLTGAEGILEQNDTEAYLWARKAASSEPPLAKAMFAMGYFSEQGIGCPASLEDARRWYGRAASYKFPKALERLEDLKKNGKQKVAPVNGKLSRKDQKKDEADCVVM